MQKQEPTTKPTKYKTLKRSFHLRFFPLQEYALQHKTMKLPLNKDVLGPSVQLPTGGGLSRLMCK